MGETATSFAVHGAEHRKSSGPRIATVSLAVALIAALAAANTGDVAAAPIDAKDAAAARLARKEAAQEGRLQLPLPGTPDPEVLASRLGAAGLSMGLPALIRIFKAESELEIWMLKDNAYVRFATYPICYWSGSLGAKLREGDRQAPEGFYTITPNQLHDSGRWRRALDIGFPNAYDRALGRDGSYILVHGGCNSIGCFAMTDRVNAEIYDIVSATLGRGIRHVPVHVFPFRMSDEHLAANASSPWMDFWSGLKQGYDSFERTRLPPRIGVCDGKYQIADADAETGMEAGPVEACAPITIANVAATIPALAGLQGGPAATVLTADAAAQQVSEDEPAVRAPKVKKRRSFLSRCSAARSSCRRWASLRQTRASAGANTSYSYVHARPRARARLR